MLKGCRGDGGVGGRGKRENYVKDDGHEQNIKAKIEDQQQKGCKVTLGR